MADGSRAHLGRHIQRRYWDAWDPTLISECVFATANIFSSLKLVHMFTINPHLGPLQISLGCLRFSRRAGRMKIGIWTVEFQGAW